MKEIQAPFLLIIVGVLFVVGDFKENINDWYNEWLNGYNVRYIGVNELRDKYDFIVVGAGVGGSVVAHRLAMNNSNVKVLLLEAGNVMNTSGLSRHMVPSMAGLNQFTDDDWGYYTETQEYCCNWKIDKKDYWPRGKVMGGSGVLNYMMWMRGHKEDWDYIMDIDNWKWNDVLPYFIKTETYHSYNDKYDTKEDRGHNGPTIVNDIRNARNGMSEFMENMMNGIKNSGLIDFVDNGMNMNGHNIGIGFKDSISDDNGLRNTAFLAYNKYLKQNYPNEYKNNLDILPNAHVLKILFDINDNITANGVTFADLLDHKTEYSISLNTFGEVIVSGGTINSPQLLMLSGLGPKEDLQKLNITAIKDIPGVGNNLQDHVIVVQRWHYTDKFKHNTVGLDKIMDHLTDFDKFKDFLFHGKSILASPSTLSGFYRTNITNQKYGNITTYPDIQFYFLAGFPGTEMINNFIPNITLQKQCGKTEYWDDRDNMPTIATIVCMQHPESRGYIKLRSKNPFEYPIIQPNYLKEKYDVQVLMEGIKFVNKLMHVDDIKQMWDERIDCQSYGNIYNNDTALEQFIRDSISTEYHPSMYID